MKNLKSKVYFFFSDTAMIALALLVIPVMIAHNFVKLSHSQAQLIAVVDWFIWTAFFLEFSLKLLLEKKKLNWLTINWFDSVVNTVVILSPLLEHFSTYFFGAPALRLLRLSRLTRLVRLAALGLRVQHTWKKIDLKVYVSFFLILGLGFIASFGATKFKHAAVDVTWMSLFVSTFGVFYAVLISFFVVHIWSKYNSISSQISQEVNSLRNVFLLNKQLPRIAKQTEFSTHLTSYLDEVVDTLWKKEYEVRVIHDKFLKLIEYFNSVSLKNKTDVVILDNILSELRISSSAQANLINLTSEKTPKILWILLIILSIVLIGSFIFLGFENQLLATILISLVSAVTGLVVALIFDIDTPFQAGFWNISPDLYLNLKKFISSF